jgi:histidine ammonia-lyase
MSACQAIEFRRPLKSSTILEAAHEFVRGFVGFAREDRIFGEDIRQLHAIIHDFSFVQHSDSIAAIQQVRLNAGFEEAFSL